MSDLNFGKYAVLQPVEHRFEQEPDWVWRIKPISSGDELAMQQYLWQNRSIVTNGVREERPPVTMEIAHREIAMCFAGTNIPKTTNKDDQIVPVTDSNGTPIPILSDGARIDEVETVLRRMPPAMVNEIWKKVGEVNPTWGPSTPKKTS